jgi:hypothetical protein
MDTPLILPALWLTSGARRPRAVLHGPALITRAGSVSSLRIGRRVFGSRQGLRLSWPNREPTKPSPVLDGPSVLGPSLGWSRLRFPSVMIYPVLVINEPSEGDSQPSPQHTFFSILFLLYHNNGLESAMASFLFSFSWVND